MRYIKKYNETLLDKIKSGVKKRYVNLLGKLTNQKEVADSINKYNDTIVRLNDERLNFSQIYNAKSYVTFSFVEMIYKQLFPNNSLLDDVIILMDHLRKKMYNTKKANRFLKKLIWI